MFSRRKVDWWRPLWARLVATVVLVQSTPAAEAWWGTDRERRVAESRGGSDRWAQVSARAPPPRWDHKPWLPHARGLLQREAYGWPRIWRRTNHVKRLCRAFWNNTRHPPWAQESLRNPSWAVMRVELSQRRVVNAGTSELMDASAG